MYALPVFAMLVVLTSACATNTGNDDSRAQKKSTGAATADQHVGAAGSAVAAQPPAKPAPAAKPLPQPTQPKKVKPAKATTLAKASKPTKLKRQRKVTPAVQPEELAANTDEADAQEEATEVADVKPQRLEPSSREKAQIPPSSQVRKELRQLQAQRAAAKRAAMAQAALDKKKAERVERFVAAETLNVRATPSESAPVVGKLARGSMLPVEINGAWAKIGEGQWVMTKYLSASRPSGRRVAYGK